MQPPFAWHSPTNTGGIQSNDICFSTNASTSSTKLISQNSPNSSINAPPLYNNSTNSQYYNSNIQESTHYYRGQNSQIRQNQEERTLPILPNRGQTTTNNNILVNNQQPPPNCSWGVVNTQMHHFVPTPSTPVPAIYSGTSPSPPQRFGVGGVGGGGTPGAR